MRIALSGAASPLGVEVAQRLVTAHEVVGIDAQRLELPGVEWCEAGDWSQARLAELMAGCEVAVDVGLFAYTSERGLNPEQTALDRGGRITYNLVNAARQAGAARFVLAGSLTILAGHDPDLVLTENFRPLPETDPAALSFHLAETVCRELRRELGYRAAVLRLGRLVLEEDVAGQPYDPFWLDLRDAAAAVAGAAVSPEPDWWQWRGIVHVCAARPDAASQTNLLRHWTGVVAAHNFGYQPEVQGS